MWKWGACIAFMGFAIFTNALDNFTMSVSPPPVPGKPFTITWNPDTSGQVSILLNNFDPANPTLDIILFADGLAVVSDTGSWVWNVPATLCGRFSFSIAADMVNRYNYGPIWTIPCPSTSTGIVQTTACSSSIPSPTGANTFLVPNADNYPVRVGKEINISWKPTTSGTVSIRALSASNTETTTIAGESLTSFYASKGADVLRWRIDKIANSGTFAWTPPSDLAGPSSVSTAGGGYTLEIVDDASQEITSTSPSINVLLPNYQCKFLNLNDWIYPVLGQTVTIQWSPSNASTISIQVTSGMVPDLSNSVYIATNVPNNGSFTWNVSPTFTPGRYTVIAATPGHLFDDLHVVVISTTTPSPCSPLANSAAPSSTPQATDTTISSPDSVTATSTFSLSSSATSSSSVVVSSSTSPAAAAALLALNYKQILQTTCINPITPSYTSFTSSGKTTLFPTVGCAASAPSGTTSPIQACHSEYLTFSIASNSSVCCPSAWQTSSLDVLYCFTSVSAAGEAAIGARTLQGSVTSSTMQPSMEPTVVVISDIVFTRAGTVTSGSASMFRSLPSMSLWVGAGVVLLSYL